MSSSQITVHEAFWKVPFVCLKGMLKWKYSEALPTLSEVQDSGTVTQLWTHSGQSSPVFKPSARFSPVSLMDLTLKSQALSEFPNFVFLPDPIAPKAQHDTNLPLPQWQQSCRKEWDGSRGSHTPNKSVSTFLLPKRNKA